ncbi:hypothetical protein HBI56_133700 [Parastagonospora nodorum]|uniref:Uncharacterized protein n=1 Tax=Phaeosphaeria nodorum (strain SN15 / ATCC MYA-4574 / FGSC 10173) TaxID=321614 RepID=A0A7U2F766_PHANO|nr:hypothetical protein HBH56_036800 [Parastagonospora nodorum]QRC99998.1 hypothetical protein JI435_414360 [Parastagonospora nodorum SN15]KAH3934057.1 hypothetical protein HBH54_062670 [Parastagonospora nodorum]KAH3952619.1 hypothetical protein HBH53_047450 [Parastagonospora nodorum]KAH3979475.1 hypothetical protein HBH51_058450 [Parastagonospora nodorum]
MVRARAHNMYSTITEVASMYCTYIHRLLASGRRAGGGWGIVKLIAVVEAGLWVVPSPPSCLLSGRLIAWGWERR